MLRWRHLYGLGLLEDSRYACRLMRKAPMATTIAIASIALGTGITIALFQLVNALQFRPLPVWKPSELVGVQFPHPGWYPGNWDTRYPELSYPLFEAIRARQQAFTQMFAWSPDQLLVGEQGESRVGDTIWVTGAFFDALGVKPVQGRLLTSADDVAGCPATAVVSYEFWNREFRQRPAGPSTILIEGHPVEVLGVTPERFYGVERGRTFDIALPTCARSQIRGGNVLSLRTYFWLAAGGRLKPGWTATAASQHLAAIAPSVFAETVSPQLPPDVAARYRAATLTGFSISAGFSTIRDEYQRALLIVLSIAGVVLLIGCMNVGGLVLARTNARGREIAARLALGASRGRVIRQLSTENLALALIGTCGGLLLGGLLCDTLVELLSTHGNPVVLHTPVDWRTVLFACVLAALTCVLSGVIPAIRMTQMPPSAVLNATARTASMSRERKSMQRAFGIVQVGLSVILSFAAIVLAISARRLTTVDAGFRPDPILVADVDVRRLTGTDEAKAAVKQEILRRLGEMSGVEAIAEARQITWGDFYFTRVLDDSGSNRLVGEAAQNWVGPKYFDTLGIPLLVGRDFDTQDTPHSPKVTVVNEEFVRRYLPGRNPVGSVVLLGANRPFTIVGVVGNTKYRALREQFQPISYLAAYQNERPYLAFTVYVRSPRVTAMLPLVRTTIADVAPGVRVDVQGFREQLRESLLRERLVATLASVFAVAGVVLLCVGIYGSTSLLVDSRQREFGIRIVLGARSPKVVWPVLKEALVISGTGVGLGIPLALSAGGLLKGLLFDVSPYSPVAALTAVVAMLSVTMAASYRPAMKACRVDPIDALRSE